MMWRLYFNNSRARLDIVAGLVDGILNALILAAGRIVSGDNALDIGLVIRVAVATGLTTVMVFFLAHYAELRAELVRAERELNLLTRGRLATSKLGQQALHSAAEGALIAAVCGIVGAATSLLLCIYLPGPPWIGLIAIFVLLGLLGALLAKSFYGSPLVWGISVILCGVVLSFVGVKIGIIT